MGLKDLSVVLAVVVSAVIPATLLANPALRIGNVTAAPGETDVQVPIEIDTEGAAFAGWSVILKYDHNSLALTSVEDLQGAEIFEVIRQEVLYTPGTILRTWLSRTDPSRLVPNGSVAILRFCVLPWASPGTYSIQLGRNMRGYRNGRDFFWRESMCFAPGPIWSNGSYIIAQTGEVKVEGDPVSTSGCIPEPPPLPGGDLHGTFRLQDVWGTPGGEVSVPFFVSGSGSVYGFAASIDFDEAVLQAGDVDVHPRADGEPASFAYTFASNDDQTPGNAGVDEGFVIAVAVFDNLGDDNDIPPSTEKEVAAFHFNLRPEAALGTQTALRFVDGGRGEGQPVYNVIGIDNKVTEPQNSASIVFTGARLSIVGDLSLFIRGDSDGSEALDLSDAVFTFNYLFLGGRTPSCLDAADANDDGRIDIADAIAILDSLFLSSGALPHPAGVPGKDVTDDALDCRV